MADAIRIRALGGVGRFGANSLLVEDLVARAAIVVDCGVRLLVDEPFGFDFALPDLGALSALDGELVGYAVTHAHEDHIGALPYALERRVAPVFATSFSARMVERRFVRSQRPLPVLREVRFHEPVKAGPFELRWVPVSHSIPDAAAVAVRTRAGTLVHSGDFRVDEDPVLGLPTDLPGLAALGDEGVLCLLSDSTGADLPGKNPGERSVMGPLREAMQQARGRVVVATFSSHVSRLKVLEGLCQELGRRLCILGRGMRGVVELAQRHGLLSPDVISDEGQISGVARERLCLAVTGSQGELGSALFRLAHERHGALSLEPGDQVIFSSRIVPGSELSVLEVIDRLRALGVEVLDGRGGRHVSGHGFQEDLETLLAATRPRFFVALHGAPRQLLAHRALARRMGVPDERVLPLESGGALVFDDDGAPRLEEGPHHEPFARGPHVIEQPGPTLSSRRRMAAGGVLVVVLRDEGVKLAGRALDPALDEEALLELAGGAADALFAGAPVDEALLTRLRRMDLRLPEVVVVDARTEAAP